MRSGIRSCGLTAVFSLCGLTIIFYVVSALSIKLNIPLRNSEVSLEIKKLQIYNLDKSTRILWTVVNKNGVEVLQSLEENSPNTSNLPQGSLITGNSLALIIKTYKSDQAKNGSIFLKSDFPINGWIPLFTPSLSINIKALNITSSFHPTHHPKCSDLSNTQRDKYLVGGDLKKNDFPILVSSAKECCSACATTLSCENWSFQSNGQCWLKGKGVFFRPSKIFSVSGIIQESFKLKENLSMMQLSEKKEIKFQRQQNRTKTIPFIPCCRNENQNNLILNLNEIEKIRQKFIKPKNQWYKLDILPPPLIQQTLKERGGRVEQGSPWLLSLERSSPEWWEQWPVGNGRFGGLVGGTLSQELIPLSVAGLFLKRRGAQKERLSPDGETFQMAREALKRGDMRTTNTLLSSLESDDLGIFQSFFDIVLRFSLQSFKKPSVKTKTVKKALKGRAWAMGELDRHFEYFVKDDKTFNKVLEFSKPLFSRGLLDLKRGISHSFFLEQIYKNQLDEGKNQFNKYKDPMEVYFNPNEQRIHHREWFVSEKDQIMVGSMTCISLYSSGIPGCLNLAIRLHRAHFVDVSKKNVRNKEKFTIHFNPYNLTEQQQKRWSDRGSAVGDRNKKTQSFTFSVELNGNGNLKIPKTKSLGVIICVGGSSLTTLTSKNFNSDTAVACNSATQVYVLLSISSEGATFSPGTNTSLKETIDLALEKGYNELLYRHQNLFSSRMSRVDLSLQNVPSTQQCPDNSQLKNRLESFQSGCLSIETSQFNTPKNSKISKHTITIEDQTTLDLLLVSQTYQFGRYLLLSSATQAVSNLQGIWGDGPDTPWSGDYHLNINLQMMYWAADAAGLPETMVPLTGFIDRLQERGSITAREMYGYKNTSNENTKTEKSLAWVTHGYTDGDSTDVLGATHWAFCVTCGAWTALLLWEHVLSRGFDGKGELEGRVVHWFRGLVLFFRHYLWEEDGVVHSGPSTSPENSYEVVENDKLGQGKKEKTRRMPSLAFDPAFDISTLRQVASVFLLMVQWSEPEQNLENSEKHLNWKDDLSLAESFVELINKMPNHAIPLIGPNSTGSQILEYPRPLFYLKKLDNTRDICRVVPPLLDPRVTTLGSSTQCTSRVLQPMDPGHRHFSGLQWLFPGSLLPLIREKERNYVIPELLEAARRTLEIKNSFDAGHTGWSSIWEASLWARVGKKEESLKAMKTYLSLFSAPNLLSLHPPLNKNSGICLTCFSIEPHVKYKNSQRQRDLSNLLIHIDLLNDFIETYQDITIELKNEAFAEVERNIDILRRVIDIEGGDDPFLSRDRGMLLTDSKKPNDGSKFQLDGNIGFIGLIHEMFMQSHIPGFLHFFPSVPYSFVKGSGHFYGLKVRGDITVSFQWEHGKIMALEMIFNSKHPWLYNIELHSKYQGFYNSAENKENSEISLFMRTPNPLKIVQYIKGNDIKKYKICNARLQLKRNSKTSDWLQNLVLFTEKDDFSCRITFCGVEKGRKQNVDMSDEKEKCRKSLEELERNQV